MPPKIPPINPKIPPIKPPINPKTVPKIPAIIPKTPPTIPKNMGIKKIQAKVMIITASVLDAMFLKFSISGLQNRFHF